MVSQGTEVCQQESPFLISILAKKVCQLASAMEPCKNTLANVSYC